MIAFGVIIVFSILLMAMWIMIFLASIAIPAWVNAYQRNNMVDKIGHKLGMKKMWTEDPPANPHHVEFKKVS